MRPSRPAWQFQGRHVNRPCDPGIYQLFPTGARRDFASVAPFPSQAPLSAAKGSGLQAAPKQGAEASIVAAGTAGRVEAELATHVQRLLRVHHIGRSHALRAAFTDRTGRAPVMLDPGLTPATGCSTEPCSVALDWSGAACAAKVERPSIAPMAAAARPLLKVVIIVVSLGGSGEFTPRS